MPQRVDIIGNEPPSSLFERAELLDWQVMVDRVRTAPKGQVGRRRRALTRWLHDRMASSAPPAGSPSTTSGETH